MYPYFAKTFCTASFISDVLLILSFLFKLDPRSKMMELLSEDVVQGKS